MYNREYEREKERERKREESVYVKLIFLWSGTMRHEGIDAQKMERNIPTK